MENIINSNLTKNEIDFLNKNKILTNQFLIELMKVKNDCVDKIIICNNSYERRIVHLLSISLNLYHCRYGDWSDEYKRIWKNTYEKADKIDGLEHYKIIGVKVSIKPLNLSKKDKYHQKINK